jgi:hypothetical protein
MTSGAAVSPFRRVAETTGDALHRIRVIAIVDDQ